MGSPIEPRVAMDVLTRVGVWCVIGLLGYAIASTQDRYTNTMAKGDREEIYRQLLLVENRMRERLGEHRTGGPHDQVDLRLVAVETEIKVRLDAITQEVRLLRSEWQDFVAQQNNNN